MGSKAFGTKRRPAGKEFRDGTVGEALDDLYSDIEEGFAFLQQDAEADLAGGDDAAAIVTKVNALLAKLRLAGIIAE